GVPGMAAGGVVGSYSGNVGGLPRWAWGEMRETLHAVATSVAQAFTAALGALGGLGGGGPASGSVLALEQFAASLFPRFGWSGMQILPLGALWTRESGWNRFATNPSSGAYGIPQALPFTKMPVAAWPLWAGGQSSAAAQIGWGEPYIAQRYGTPAGAWAHEQAFGWYGDGLDAVFTRPTLIGVGERGMEHVSVTPAGRGPRTVNYNITVNVPPTVNPKQAGQQIAQLILEHTKVGGRLYPAGITPR
ncbi:MAG TPA: hypothetical protein VKD66_15185, partial [Streptosporangiaceae bacterium]|nr:hypothetical protein [Streptosporangiaceae bacterium]